MTARQDAIRCSLCCVLAAKTTELRLKGVPHNEINHIVLSGFNCDFVGRDYYRKRRDRDVGMGGSVRS